MVEDAQSHQLIAPPAAASVLEFVQTSEGAALVEHSATLATHAFAILNIQTSASVTPDQPRTYSPSVTPDQPRTYIADQPRTYTAETVSEAPAANPATTQANPATPQQKDPPS